jgi:putative transposase
MPRRARHYIAGQPYHIVQRGNNREACFIELENYQFYLELWQELSKKYGVRVHAYCLMTNHVHFLVTPDADDGISLVMKQIGSRYAQYINKKYKRTGTFWEGRHKASLVQSEQYLLMCYRYIELNPVRADMVETPEEYKWTSYHANAWCEASWIDPHEEYLRLGYVASERCFAYRELFRHQMKSSDLHRVRNAAHYCQPLGDEYFAQMIGEKYGIKIGHMARGRPKKIGGVG